MALKNTALDGYPPKAKILNSQHQIKPENLRPLNPKPSNPALHWQPHLYPKP